VCQEAELSHPTATRSVNRKCLAVVSTRVLLAKYTHMAERECCETATRHVPAPHLVGAAGAQQCWFGADPSSFARKTHHVCTERIISRNHSMVELSWVGLEETSVSPLVPPLLWAGCPHQLRLPGAPSMVLSTSRDGAPTAVGKQPAKPGSQQ